MEPRAQVAWVRVVLDLTRLSEGLEYWYRQYAKREAPQLPEPEVRLPLVAEFLREYDEFLARLGNAIFEHFGPSNVEAVFKGPGRGVVNDLWCVKIARLQDLLCLLKLYQDLLFPLDHRGPRFFCRNRAHEQHRSPYFPVTSELSGRSPIRILITSSPARFPFLQHWRQMEHERTEADDVYIQIVGKGEMRVSLRALGPVLLKAETHRQRKAAFVHLVEIAALSEALARVRLHHQDRGDADTNVYRRLREDLLPLGLSFQTIVTLAKIVGD